MPTQTETTNTPATRFHAFMEEAAVKGNRIYIAGPMTGLPDFNFPAFNYAAALLRDQGLHVENPAEHGGVDGAEWADYLRYDMGRLATCGAIYLLKGWENSKGAQLEVHVARTLGMVVMYAPGAMSVLQAELRQRPSPVLGQASELQALRKKVSTYEARDALGWLPPSALATIQQALRDYHFALDSRRHGGVAADEALNAISQAMDMRWKQGEEAVRRAAQLEQQDKAA